MGWCFDVLVLSAFPMLGTGHTELALRFPNVHHLAGAACSQLSTRIGARRKESQSDFLGHPGLWTSLLSSYWVSRKANLFHYQHQQNDTRRQVCAFLPRASTKP